MADPAPLAAQEMTDHADRLSPIVRLAPIDTLEHALHESYLDLSRCTYRFLSLLREFAFRQGWKTWGCVDRIVLLSGTGADTDCGRKQ